MQEVIDTDLSEIVIVDKPFARTTEEVDSVIKVAKEKGLVVTCFQNRRYVRTSNSLLGDRTYRDNCTLTLLGWRFPDAT